MSPKYTVKKYTLWCAFIITPFFIPGIIQLIPELACINLLCRVWKVGSMLSIGIIGLLNIVVRKKTPSALWCFISALQIVIIFSTIYNKTDINKAVEVGLQIILLSYFIDQAYEADRYDSIINWLYFLYSFYIMADCLCLIFTPNLAGIRVGGIVASKNSHIQWILPYMIFCLLKQNSSDTLNKFRVGIAYFLSALIIAISKSSTAIIAIAFIGVSFFLSIQRFEKISNMFTKIFAVICLVNYMLVSSGLKIIADKIIDLFNKQLTFGRYHIWDVAIENIRQHPLLGIGYEFPEQIAAKIKYSHVHNKFLDITYVSGFIGLALFVLILFILMRSFDKNRGKKRIYLLGCIFMSYFIVFFVEGIRYDMMLYAVIIMLYHTSIKAAHAK